MQGGAHEGRAGIQCPALQSRPEAFLACASVTLDVFQRLVPPLEPAFQAQRYAWRLDGTLRTARRFPGYQPCPLSIPKERLLFLLTYVKTGALPIVQRPCSIGSSVKPLRGSTSSCPPCSQHSVPSAMPRPVPAWPWRSAAVSGRVSKVAMGALWRCSLKCYVHLYPRLTHHPLFYAPWRRWRPWYVRIARRKSRLRKAGQ